VKSGSQSSCVWEKPWLSKPQFKGLFGSSQLGKCSSAMTTSPSSLVVDPAVPALPQSSLIVKAAMGLDSMTCTKSSSGGELSNK